MVLLFLIFLGAAFYMIVFVRVVPPISGKLVDAVTGKPVPGMSVCLQVDADGLGHHQLLRREVTKSNDSGRFFLAPSIHDMAVLQTWEGYSIRVTDPQSDNAVPCGPNLGPGLNEVHPGQSVGGREDKTRYFPVVLLKQGENDHNRNTTQRALRSPLAMRVALIPLLPNVDECGRIQDSTLARDCRDLNAEALADRKGSVPNP